LAESQVLLGSKRIKNLRVILFFDTFEQLATEAAPWLLNYFLPADIKGNIVLVIAGRDPIERSIPEDMKHWLPYCDNETIYWIPLNSFTEDETRVYLTKRNITDPERITTIWQLSQGLPLYLSLLTTNLQGKVDPTKDVVDNFLRWIPQQERVKRRLVLDAALLSKPFNQDDLEVFTYLSENERDSIYDWLIGQPFVRSNPQDGRYSYHELAQELFSRHLYQRSQKAYYTTRRALANHYQQLLEEIQAEGNEDSAMWSELALAQVHQLFLLPDEAAHIQAIKQILHIYKRTNKESEIIKVLHELSREQYLKQTTSNARRNIQMLLQLIGTDWWDNQGDLVAASSAASTLLEILTLTPSFPTELLVPIYYMQGWMRYRLEEHKQAIADFTLALELDPSYFAAYRALGIVSREFDDLQSSIDALNRALELDPMSANVYMNRGWTYHFSGETQLAIADFDHALELDPQVTDAYTGLGWVHFQLKEYKQALADFDHALKLDLKSRDAWHGRGWVHFQLKEYEQALADFDHFIEIYEKNPWVYLRRGMTYSYLKKYQQALADFDRALALDPKNRETYLQRGRTYLWLKDIKRGYADFSRGWEIDSTNVYCGWIAEWANMCQEKPDSRVPERLEAIAATDPMHYAAKVSRGSACWLQGDFEAAGAELEQALQLQPERWDAFFWRGMVCASLGQDEAAIAAVEKALALELPPVLLAPLSWFEQDKPDFYQKHVVPLMARYDLV